MIAYGPNMYRTLPGKCEEGVIRLTEPVSNLADGPVLVTFLEANFSDACPLTRAERAEVRGQLTAWDDDWSAPGMDVYNQS